MTEVFDLRGQSELAISRVDTSAVLGGCEDGSCIELPCHRSPTLYLTHNHHDVSSKGVNIFINKYYCHFTPAMQHLIDLVRCGKKI